MHRTAEREKGLLATLVLQPEFMDRFDLTAADFSPGRMRQTFEAAADLWEDGRQSPLDEAGLADKIGGDGALTFVSNLTSGAIRIEPAVFEARLRALRQTACKNRILAMVEQAAKSEDPDLDAVKPEWDRLGALAEGDLQEKAPNFAARRASGVATRHIAWLWPGVVPFSMPTALEGDMGVGKTFVAADITARVTRGMGFPAYGKQDHFNPEPGSVVYITSEGVPDQILVPRLIAAGADLERVEIIEGTYNDHGGFAILDINSHLPALARRLKNGSLIKLVVIDPLASHLSPKINMNATLEMRQAMDCIARFAEEVGCAVLVVMHLNKDDRKAAIHRAAGSGQIMAAVKSAWAVVKKPDDEDDNRRYFGPVKSNIAPFRRSISFEIQSTPVPLDDGTTDDIGRVTWSLEPEEFDMQAAISPGAFELKSKVGAAVTFLRERLAGGKRLARELYAEAEAKGINGDRLRTAKRKEGIEDGREGYGGPSVWFYPTEQKEEIQ